MQKRRVINFTLYTVGKIIKRAFQPYIGLFSLDLLSGLKCHDIEAYILYVIIFISPVYFFSCRKQCAYLQHVLRHSTWVINFTLYTVGKTIKRAFQPYIGLYTFEFFFWVKMSRHWGIYSGRNYFYLKFIWPLRFGFASLRREFTPWFGVRCSPTYTPLQAPLNFLSNTEKITLPN